MAEKIPELSLKSATEQLEHFCSNCVPEQARNQIKIFWRQISGHLTLLESRPHFLRPKEWFERGVAQFRFKDNKWHLYCLDRNDKWHRFTPEPETKDFEKVLAAVSRDDTGIFWG